MATKIPIGMEMIAHTKPCSTVPTIAWYTPPPGANAVMPACEWVNQVGAVIALTPLTITEYSTHSNGTSAISTDDDTSTVAKLLVTFRRRLTPWKVVTLTGRASVEVIAHPSLRRRPGPA